MYAHTRFVQVCVGTKPTRHHSKSAQPVQAAHADCQVVQPHLVVLIRQDRYMPCKNHFAEMPVIGTYLHV